MLFFSINFRDVITSCLPKLNNFLLLFLLYEELRSQLDLKGKQNPFSKCFNDSYNESESRKDFVLD